MKRPTASWTALRDPRRSANLRRSVVGYAAILLCIGWGYTLLNVQRDRLLTIDAAKHQLATMAVAIENHVHAMIHDGVGAAEAGAREVHARGALGTVPAAEISATLSRMLKGGEYVREIFIAAPGLFARAARGAAPGEALRTPPWVAELLARTDETTWIGPRTVRTDRDRSLVFPIAKRLSLPDGVSVWVGALFGVEALDRLYEGLPIPGGAVSLVAADGGILLRAPRLRRQEEVLRTASVSEAFKERGREALRIESGRLIFEARNPIDEQPWMIAVDRVDGYPLVAASGQSLEALLAGWRAHARSTIQVAVASTAIVALLTALLILTLREAQGRELRAREEFSRQLLAGQEQERKRIANELHDSLGQNLSVISNRAQLAALEPGLPPAAARHLGLIDTVARETIGEVRALVHNLQPLYIDQLGLTESLRALTEQMASAAQLPIESHIEDLDDVFRGTPATHVFRILQEALTNAARHARASGVRVLVERDIRSVRLSVRDDGRGFAPQTSPGRHAGLGLSSIAERAHLLGGELRVRSAPGEGCELIVELPIAEASATIPHEPAAPTAPAAAGP